MDVQMLIIQLSVIFVLAKLAGMLCERLGQPSLVGEIIVGIVLIYPTVNDHLQLDDPTSMSTISLFAQLGVIFLVFSIGLETRSSEVRKVGRTAFLVALLGVVVPFVMGLSLILVWKGVMMMGEALFLGAALVATSVAITARVLQEVNAMKREEAMIILSAAVIDDVMGIVVLTMVAGLSGGTLNIVDLVTTIVLASAFVVFFLFFGGRIVAKLTSDDSRLSVVKRARGHDAPLVLALIFCLGMSLLAEYLKLAAIIGAFFAGMAFAEVKDKFHLEARFGTLTSLMAPFFFVFLGLQIKGFGWSLVWLVSTMLIIMIAILSKWIGCMLPVWKSRGSHSASIVGVGMIPRGEVGMIVALVGLGSGMISTDIYASVIFMAIATSMIAPTVLKRLLMSEHPNGHKDWQDR